VHKFAAAPHEKIAKHCHLMIDTLGNTIFEDEESEQMLAREWHVLMFGISDSSCAGDEPLELQEELKV